MSLLDWSKQSDERGLKKDKIMNTVLTETLSAAKIATPG
jgi:hypothetical protein